MNLRHNYKPILPSQKFKPRWVRELQLVHRIPQRRSCCLQDSTTGKSYSSARCSCSQCHAGNSKNGEQWCTYISQFGQFLALKTWLPPFSTMLTSLTHTKTFHWKMQHKLVKKEKKKFQWNIQHQKKTLTGYQWKR